MTQTTVQPDLRGSAPAGKKGRILTGDRPTGKLHLGHYVGSLANRVRLIDQYDCFFIIADYHVLTTKSDTSEVGINARDLVLDYISVGMDPERCTIYLQSLVPQTCELHLLFSMLTSVPRLQRVPTLKDVMRDLQLETASYGLLGYPVLQAADILIVRGNLVPVARTRPPTSKSPARSPAASTSSTARPSRSRTPSSATSRPWSASTARPRCPRA